MSGSFKKTEVGHIPADWICRPIGEIAYVGRGRVISHREISRALSPTYPVYSSQTSNNGVMGYLDTYDFEGAYVTWTTDGVNAGTVFYRSGKFNCTNVCGTIKPIQHNTFYVALALSQRTGRYVSRNLANPKLMNDVMKQVAIALPPSVDEQYEIANAITESDELIISLELLIAKKRDIQQAAMQQLLTGQRRLPGFSREWTVRRLGDHLSFLRNGTNSRAELSAEGDVHYLHYGDIHGSQYLLLNPATTSIPCLPRDKAKRLDRLENGDLVFADASEDLDGVGKSVEVQLPENMELVSGLHTIAVRFDKEVMADGFKAYLQFIPKFRSHLRQLAAGTKVYATNRSHIASAELKLPGIEEQAAIASILSDMDTELAALEARRDKTRQLKQGMMQELLTGRIRLV